MIYFNQARTEALCRSSEKAPAERSQALANLSDGLKQVHVVTSQFSRFNRYAGASHARPAPITTHSFRSKCDSFLADANFGLFSEQCLVLPGFARGLAQNVVLQTPPHHCLRFLPSARRHTEAID